MAIRSTTRLDADTSRYERGMARVKRVTKDVQKETSKGFSLGRVVGGTAVVGVLGQIAQRYDRIAKLSDRFNLDNGQILQGLGFAAEQNGASLELLAKGLQTANRAGQEAGAGLATYTRAFEQLGIEVSEFNALDQREQFLRIADAVAEATDRNEALAAVQTVLGRAGAELVPLLEQGSEAIRELSDAIVTLDDVQLDNIEKFNDNLNKMRTQGAAAGGSILGVLVPAVESLGATSAGTFAALRNGFEGVLDGVAALGQGDFRGVGAAIEEATLGSFAAGFRTTSEGLKEVWGDAGEDAGEEFGKQLGAAINDNSEAAAAEAAERIAERVAAEAEALEVILKLQEELNAAVAESAALRRDEAAQLEFLQGRLAEVRTGGRAAVAGGDREAALRAAIEQEKLVREIGELEITLAEEASEVRRASLEDEAAALREQLAVLGRERALIGQIEDGFAPEVDRLTAIGLGPSNASFDGIEKLDLTNQLLRDLNRKVGDLELDLSDLEVSIDEDSFAGG